VLKAYIAALWTSFAVVIGMDAVGQSAQSPRTAGESGTDQSALQEIIITAARKRNEDVQSVPIAITALSAADLEQRGVTGFTDLSGLAPSLELHRSVASVSQASIFLRGFGSDSNDPSIDPPIAVVVDGIYQPTFSGNLVDLFDVQSVEIERGPQGTLLGKNAPTGALMITSRRPTGDYGSEVQVGYERFGMVRAKARSDFPIISGILAGNFSISYAEGGDYVRDLYTGRTEFGGVNAKTVRGSLLFTPSSNFKWYVSARAELRRDPQSGVRDISYYGANGPLQRGAIECAVFGFCTPTQPNTNSADLTGATRSDTVYVTSQMDYSLTPVTLTSLTGYIHDHHVNVSDSDAVELPLLGSPDNPAHYSQVSEEVRLASNKNGGLDLNGRLDWLFGGYFSNFRYEDTEGFNILGTILGNNQQGTSRSEALFGHAIYKITDAWSVSVGGRETWDRKTHDYISTGETIRYFDAPATWNNFSVDTGTQYQISPHQLAYFRFGQGYRGGGFQGLPSPGGTGGTYNPETVNTLEIGMKADFLEQRLRVNAAAYDSTYHDLQQSVLKSLPIAPFFQQIIGNAASAKTRGAELEVTAVPMERLTLNASLGYIDAKYEDFVASIIPGPPTDNSQFPFPYTSKWTGSLGESLRMSLPNNLGSATLNASWDYRSAYSAANLPYPAAQVGGLGLVDASLKLTDNSGRYSLSFYGQNITNHQWPTSILTVPGQVAPFFITLDSKPAVYGVTFDAKFQ
jgi:iron complex outermembrane receptor protein